MGFHTRATPRLPARPPLLEISFWPIPARPREILLFGAKKNCKKKRKMVENRWEMVEKVEFFRSPRDPARPLPQPARPRATSSAARAHCEREKWPDPAVLPNVQNSSMQSGPIPRAVLAHHFAQPQLLAAHGTGHVLKQICPLRPRATSFRTRATPRDPVP